MRRRFILPVLGFMLVFTVTTRANVIDELLQEWALSAARPFTAEAGHAAWYRDVEGRSCPSCHTDSVYVEGRHERTGKVIAPMAPSVNPERLSERKHINKWFKRNCKWTYGRECTAQEKGDILTWLQQQ